MEEEMISQTRFDQLVSDDQSQMLKRLYSISPAQKSRFSLYLQKQESFQTPWLCFRADRQRCRSAPLLLLLLRIFWMISVNSAMASREQIDQISNFLVMIQLIQVMNSSGMEEGDTSGTELAE